MLTFAVLGFLLGICLLVASLTSLLLKLGGHREVRLLGRTPPTPLSTWRPGSRRVAGTGRTAYGPAGPVVAPVSDVECAWYLVRLVRTPSRRAGDGNTGEDVLLELAAPAPPALTDESGTVLIDPRLLTTAPNLDDPLVTDLTMRILIDSSTAPAFVPRGLIEGRRGHESLHLWETRLVADRWAYAFGSTGRGRGEVVLRPVGRDGFTVFTTDELSTVLQRRRDGISASGHLTRTLGVAGGVVTVVGGALTYVLAYL